MSEQAGRLRSRQELDALCFFSAFSARSARKIFHAKTPRNPTNNQRKSA
jgi:uroporphyrinogen-III synthase